MINLFAILLSTGMVMYIVVRAAKLDRIRPWFETRSLYEQEQRRERGARGAKGQNSPRPPGRIFLDGSTKCDRRPGSLAPMSRAQPSPTPEKTLWG